MVAMDNVCQYLFGGVWQTCKLLDFHSLGYAGIIYSIEFKGNFINVFSNEIRFLKDNEQLLFVPLQPKNLNSEVVFQ